MASVLIVEDDSCIQDVLSRFLLMRGHKVAGVAINGAEAVDTFISMNPKPDIIVMDYRMPVMNGVEATREILQIDPSVRILFLSADGSVKDEAIEAGALDFLRKPTSYAEIIAFIEKHTASQETDQFTVLTATP